MNGTDYIFSVVYRHPGAQFNNFQLSLEHSVESFINHKVKYYSCGDFNIDLLKYETRSS